MLHINLYFFHFVPRRGFHFSKQSYLVSSVWLWTLHFIFTPVWPQSSSQLKLTWNSKTYLKGMTFPLFHAILRSYQSNFILSYLNQTPINAKPKYNIIIQKPFSLSSVFLILWWDSRVHSPTLKIKVFLQEKKYLLVKLIFSYWRAWSKWKMSVWVFCYLGTDLHLLQWGTTHLGYRFGIKPPFIYNMLCLFGE